MIIPEEYASVSVIKWDKEVINLKTSIKKFLNLANNGENKMRTGTSVEKDILVRTLLLNIKIDNKKELFSFWNEPFKTLLESLSVNLGAPVCPLGHIR